ncbi:MAG: ABC transporter ATP-binding protein/permease, partial [Gammaproteobacteria bacterium]|nr:ABC transporter ATP-binding protein/permease [Gammaproteobacteria bacterium]
MLKLIDIKKNYEMKGQEPVRALRGVTVSFRRNEFVAVLGPSGCGKTTLLNIVGGLDRYTSGDLVIEGKSTKKYGDRDWDTYRNHSIGFVFQAYNLIGHQTILKNVELALTISGIAKKERKQRAMEALDRVGLKGLYNKKPNQLSGGQMQRVAIARSLVNNPEILLADEPTGALDSETSIQIMDLLKKVAADRLVIMVTHNPELAEKYATRIVSMKDGVILGDTNPYDGETKEELEKALEAKKEVVQTKGKNKSAMSFFTATGLSFSNLLSKLKRTILITIAGSIGIIGVSAVLAVRQGVVNYVDGMQDDMLSSYPVSISENPVDYSSLISGLSNWDKKQIAELDLTDKIAVDSMIDYLMDKYKDVTRVKTNEINEDLLKFIKTIPEEYLASINYDYGVDLTNNIFCEWKKTKDAEVNQLSLNGLTQRYIKELTTVKGFGEYARFVDLFTDFMKQIPGSEEYILGQYDLLGKDSRFPTEANEMMVVVDSDKTLTDICLGQLGFFTEEDFLNLAKYAIESHIDTEGMSEEELAEHNRKLEEYDYARTFTYEEILGKKFTYIPHDSMYTWTEKRVDNVSFEFEDLTFLGQTLDLNFDLDFDSEYKNLEGTISLGTAGGEFPATFTLSSETPQSPDSHTKGKWEGVIMEGTSYEMPFTFTLTSEIEHKVSTELPLIGTLNSNFSFSIKNLDGYRYPAKATSEMLNAGMEMKIVGILQAKPTTQFGCLSRGVYFTPKLTEKYMQDAANSQIVTNIDHGMKPFINSDQVGAKTYKAYTTFDYDSYKNYESEFAPGTIIPKSGEAMCLNMNLSGSLSSMIMGTSYEEANKSYLRSVSGIAAKLVTKEFGNVTYTEYEFDSVPKEISLYPKDFSKKDAILRHLDKWNQEGDIGGLSLEEREELTYTDTIGMIISVIDTLINAISIALIAFTSLSLVVSCFMIAVITYISTMERVKEIGVIRSLGGRKKDVSRLFIAETLIIGTASGVFGILVTEGLVAILNVIINNLAG